MDRHDVIIIGAGAAGLIAARKIAEKGKTVLLLEANGHAGGRIRRLKRHGFSEPVETGAEFVHGILPETLSLLKEAGLSYKAMRGKTVSIFGGRRSLTEGFGLNWPELTKRLNALGEDTTISNFLENHFSAQGA